MHSPAIRRILLGRYAKFVPFVAVLFGLVGCEPDTTAYSLNRAIRESRQNKDELSIVHAVAKERRTEEKGLYSFFDMEEPNGRPFVAQSSIKLQYDHEYNLVGRAKENGFRGRDLFIVEDIYSPFPWTWVIGVAGALVLVGAASRYRHIIRERVSEAVIPEPVAPADPRAKEPTIDVGHEGFVAQTPLPSANPALVIQEGTPKSISPSFNTFNIPFDKNRSEPDAQQQQHCTIYQFGRLAEHNDFVLDAKYIKRQCHFRVTVYQDENCYVEVNPESRTPVEIRDTQGNLLPLAPNHPQRLEHDYTVTIGDIKLKYQGRRRLF